jgi:hypothetical protein
VLQLSGVYDSVRHYRDKKLSLSLCCVFRAPASSPIYLSRFSLSLIETCAVSFQGKDQIHIILNRLHP